MSNDFASALRQALQQTRASDPAAATATIQAALNGRSLPQGGALPLRGPARPAAEPAATGLPDGARFTRHTHAGPHGRRDYLLYVPSPRPEGHGALVMMLHGCTQSAEDFARGTAMNALAERHGLVVAYPEQARTENPQGCWSWFRPEDQTRERGEPALLAALAGEVAGAHACGDRVFVAGLSAGGAMAAILAETHPDLVVAAGVHSGLPAGSARDVASAFAAMNGQAAPAPRPRKGAPLIVFHGSADRTVVPANGAALVPGAGIETSHSGQGRRWTRLTADDSELWRIEGLGHAWSGGDPAGSYTDAAGPDASAEMVRFFLAQKVRA
ncbi:PHB depolymerase family esterase [Rhodobacteraceae bacterium CCMM004]|nr:PHB depolymerase family esterase [Rhodobacteraceae bacterium CCMM004]